MKFTVRSKHVAFYLILGIISMVSVSCSPGRQDQGLPPTIYVSGTSQERLSRAILARTWESLRLVHDLQRGFALPHPLRDTTRLQPSDSSYYTRRQGNPDTLTEMVRFVPDIWLIPSARADSVIYRWEVYGGDTAQNGVYAYRIASKRLAPDSLAHLTGTVLYGQRFYQVATDGYLYDYSYDIYATFDEPGGAPPPTGGALYQWNGLVLTWESDGIPTQWTFTGTSHRNDDGSWSENFAIDGDTFVQATLDSSGVGTFRNGWDNFGRSYNFAP